ncbi:uncharacterized protein [Temnothorax longispinosus]|uniref:uncharacterized protein n=1 Tax=Temnothorax longispinosus TaxID=300112 RepID=UPI003A999B53
MSLASLRLVVQRVPNFSLPSALKRAGCAAGTTMLSKWLLVSLLALVIQNISAGHFIGKYIDVTKFNSVFYDPNTRLGLKGALERIGRDPFPAIGFRGVKCNCEGFTCGCCSGINITLFNLDRRTCTNFTYSPEDFAIKFNLIVNEREVLSTGSLSAKNPPPVCVPFYPPFMSFCVRFFDVYTSGKNLHACIDLETLVVTWPVLILHFDCVKIGADGVSWMKPENGSNVSNTAPLAMLMSEVNGPEIYDPVDFEPDSVELPNNQTSILTPEQENNIGQLKL